MPHTYTRKEHPTYDLASLEEIATLVMSSGRSIGSVAKEHGIPRETLRHWVTLSHARSGAG